MFCAEDRQRESEAQVGQGYNLIDATSLGDIVLRGQQANREQREASGGHREPNAREFKEYGENSWLHGNREPIQPKFYDEGGFKSAFGALACATILEGSSATRKSLGRFSRHQQEAEQNLLCQRH